MSDKPKPKREALACGCVVIYGSTNQYIIGSDFCDTHIEVFDKLMQLNTSRDDYCQIILPKNGTLQELKDFKLALHRAIFEITCRIQEAEGPPDLGIHVSEGIGATDVFGGDRSKK